MIRVMLEGPLGARARVPEYLRGNSRYIFQKKNEEFMRHRGLEDIDFIRFMLRYFGVSRGLEISKVAFRICVFHEIA